MHVDDLRGPDQGPAWTTRRGRAAGATGCPARSSSGCGGYRFDGARRALGVGARGERPLCVRAGAAAHDRPEARRSAGVLADAPRPGAAGGARPPRGGDPSAGAGVARARRPRRAPAAPPRAPARWAGSRGRGGAATDALGGIRARPNARGRRRAVVSRAIGTAVPGRTTDRLDRSRSRLARRARPRPSLEAPDVSHAAARALRSRALLAGPARGRGDASSAAAARRPADVERGRSQRERRRHWPLRAAVAAASLATARRQSGSVQARCADRCRAHGSRTALGDRASGRRRGCSGRCGRRRSAHLPIAGLRIRAAAARASTPERAAADAGRRLPSVFARGVTIGPAAAPDGGDCSVRCGDSSGDCAVRDGPAIRRCRPAALLSIRRRARRTTGGARGAVREVVIERLRAATVQVVAGADAPRSSRGPAGRGGATRASPNACVCGGGGTRVGSAAGLPQCGAPIRYGGETIGALRCRWTARRGVDLDGAGRVLRRGRAGGGRASLRGMARPRAGDRRARRRQRADRLVSRRRWRCARRSRARRARRFRC